MLNVMPNISVGQDYPSSGATLNEKDFEQGLSAMYTKIRRCFSLAIDFFDEFGLERFIEPEKPLNEISRGPPPPCEQALRKKLYFFVPAFA